MADCNQDSYVAPQEDQVASQEKRYGGLVPKKKPLIFEDHRRAFFDSADWVLYKQGVANLTSAMTVESLRPKLQRTQHQQLPPRRPACSTGRDTTHVHVE